MFHQVKIVLLFIFHCVIFVGLFIERLENAEIRIERRLFASQEYTELLIAYVLLIRKSPIG